ncbi:hypothetical protein LOD99_1039 [Oopsacas minuta]|uniref:Uncharacterized protein n=1 Tax=Oopsacas minuta TaxID=111878 RepID=A0AAV7K0N0_9METZ|nr:hypothetical protein LOD99_1039 [Oopsacas minuta]
MIGYSDELTDITTTVEKQEGVIFAKSAIVYRQMYSGQDILAPNSSFTTDKMDNRGYLPVEWWIISLVTAENTIKKEKEGLTVLLCEKEILITNAVKIAEKQLFGDYLDKWPLTKVLDIGGDKVVPEYDTGLGEAEIPPIPCHVHAGCVKDGKCQGQGKDEAYFFPPLNVRPYNKIMPPVKTRIGIKPDTQKETVIASLAQYGRNDVMYSLLQVHDVYPWSSWMIPAKVVHAPGPWVTFEIQRPQDDFNLLAWRMGSKIQSDYLQTHKQDLQLRGLVDEKNLFEQTIDWEMNIQPTLIDKLSQKCKVLEEGTWGKKLQIFYHLFYGEGLIIAPGQSVKLNKCEKPRGGICWSGYGKVNKLDLLCTSVTQREFLVTPYGNLHIENSSTDAELIIFLVLPIV